MYPTLRLLAAASSKPKIPAQQFQRGQKALLGGARVLSGNNIPFSHHKTRRKWYPNVHNKRLYSEILGRVVQVVVTARVLRTVDKMGGFDSYILKSKAAAIGDEGMRWRVVLRQYMDETNWNLRKKLVPPQIAISETGVESKGLPPASATTTVTAPQLDATLDELVTSPIPLNADAATTSNPPSSDTPIPLRAVDILPPTTLTTTISSSTSTSTSTSPLTPTSLKHSLPRIPVFPRTTQNSLIKHALLRYTDRTKHILETLNPIIPPWWKAEKMKD